MRSFLRTAFTLLLMAPLLALAQPTTQRGDTQRSGRGQGGPGGGRMLERVQQIIEQDLQLSDAQRDKIRGILEDSRTELRELMQELRDLEPQERMEKLREFLKATHDKVAEELDDSQKKVFEEKIQQIRQNPGGGGAGPGGGQGGGQGGGGMMIERMANAIKQLDLNDDQTKQVETLLADMRKKMQEMREKVQNGADPQTVREEGRQALMDVREQLMGILTPEQQEKLRELIRPGQGGPGKPGDGQRRERRDNNRNQPGTQPSTAPEGKPSDNSGKVEATPPPDTPQAAQAGMPAPDFTLSRLDGKDVQLSSFRNRVVVLVFGSATSPSFRNKADQLQQLYRDLGSKATFFVVYTKEAHAKDDWEVDRNKDASVAITQPTNMADRVKLAKQTRDALKLTLPFVVDAMENTTVSAYGAGENAAFVIGKDGTILLRQNWCDPFRLRPAIESAVNPPATPSR